MKNILELLEFANSSYSKKVAFEDETSSITYADLYNKSRCAASCIAKECQTKKPIAIILDKTVKLPLAMFAVVYSGNFYCVIDNEMPIERIKNIFSTLKPQAIITDGKNNSIAMDLSVSLIFDIDNICDCKEDTARLDDIRDEQIDTDILYILYTSGSTGMPKGTVISHRNVLAYSEWVVKEFGFNSETVFGNQTPFYFSMSVTDIYSTLRAAAKLVIIPKQHFTFPLKLIEFMNERKINTIYWVPSAMNMVSVFNLFKVAKPEYLKTVLFAGEVMLTKHLNYWIHNLPSDVKFANLYGPTETTDICTFYVVDRELRDDEPLPIGKHCDNCNVFIHEGELFARGSFLSAGYYNNPEKTKEMFVQNPINSAYPETVYRTGDLVRINERGEIMYICRKDYQIKHMGYRIELGEIETAVAAIPEMKELACVYDDKNDKIVLFYSASKISEDKIKEELGRRLTQYMMPNVYKKLPQLPHNQNGKIDRKKLKGEIDNGENN